MDTVPNGGVAVTMAWAGEDRLFKLRLGEWRKIEAKCNAGPEEIAARLAPTAAAVDADLAIITAAQMGLAGRWRVDDAREIILQGLIGGGMDHMKATVLVQGYFDLAPMRANAGLAYAIVAASLEGLPVTKPGEPDGEADSDPSPSPQAEPDGVTSTSGADAAASDPAMLTQ